MSKKNKSVSPWIWIILFIVFIFVIYCLFGGTSPNNYTSAISFAQKKYNYLEPSSGKV